MDPQGNVWVAGGNHLVLKFSREGKFLLQLGERNMTSGSDHPTHLGAPASAGFYPPANEVFIADGYLNRRVVVFDATTGKYKRHWGRQGKPPDDSFEPHPRKAYANEPSPGPGTYPRFAHSADVSKDGLVYVADRAHLRTWVFKVDGTFVREAPTPNVINSYGFSADPEQYLSLRRGRQPRSQDVHLPEERPSAAGGVRFRRAAVLCHRLPRQPVHLRPAWQPPAPKAGPDVLPEEEVLT